MADIQQAGNLTCHSADMPPTRIPVKCDKDFNVKFETCRQLLTDALPRMLHAKLEQSERRQANADENVMPIETESELVAENDDRIVPKPVKLMTARPSVKTTVDVINRCTATDDTNQTNSANSIQSVSSSGASHAESANSATSVTMETIDCSLIGVAITTRRQKASRARQITECRSKAKSLMRDEGVVIADNRLSLCRDPNNEQVDRRGDLEVSRRNEKRRKECRKNKQWYHRSIDMTENESEIKSEYSRAAFSEGEQESSLTVQCTDKFQRFRRNIPLAITLNDADQKHTSSTNCDPEVLQWLQGLKLKDTVKYERLFGLHEIDMCSLQLLTRSRLQQMGVVAFGPLSKMVAAINELKGLHLNFDPVGRCSNDSSPTSDKCSITRTPRAAHSELTAEKRVRGKLTPDGQTARPHQSVFGLRSPRPIENYQQNFKPEPLDDIITVQRITTKPLATVAPRKVNADDNNEQKTHLIKKTPIDSHCRRAKNANEAYKKVSSENIVNLKQESDDIVGDLTSPPSSGRLVKLQNQLEAIRRQIREHRNIKEASRLDAGYTPRLPRLASSSSDGEEEKATEDTPRIDTPREVLVREGSDVICMAMSKNDLVQEVRKQKKQHREHIKQLQTELSLLKQESFASCEIAEDDISFHKDALIGEGSFSQVFYANFQGSEVAVKRLQRPLSAQDKMYFEEEVALLRELRHPRIVLLLGVCTRGTLPMMVLEYMSGGSLFNYLHDTQRVPLGHCSYYQMAHDMAVGMNYLHRHRPSILHLDVKSLNILLNSHLRAKIADFGFSKLRRDVNAVAKQQRGSQLRGTPAWMAPELFTLGRITTKADVYSYGVILWEMLTSKQPYRGCSVFEMTEHVKSNRRPEMPPGDKCPTQLRQLIEICWHQKPEKRPSFKSILPFLDELNWPTNWQAALPDGHQRTTLLTRHCEVPPLQLATSPPSLRPATLGLPAQNIVNCVTKQLHIGDPIEEQRFVYGNISSRPPGAAAAAAASTALVPTVPALKMTQTTNYGDNKKDVACRRMIAASQLAQQKLRLRPTVGTHPNQGKSGRLRGVKQNDSITTIICKAMSDRRNAMHEVASVDESVTNWSASDDEV